MWSASCTAFGQATVEVQEIPNNLRFPGQYADAETGLHYNFHRYYAPGIGRYLRVDPIKFTVSKYDYTGNNPVAFIDQKGLQIDHYGFNREERAERKEICISVCLKDFPIIGDPDFQLVLVIAGLALAVAGEFWSPPAWIGYVMIGIAFFPQVKCRLECTDPCSYGGPPKPRGRVRKYRVTCPGPDGGIYDVWAPADMEGKGMPYEPGKTYPADEITDCVCRGKGELCNYVYSRNQEEPPLIGLEDF